MYLNGKFGTNPGDVNPYAASLFYAVDRYASFKSDWQDYYNSGGTVLCARYTTSNAIHQGSKLCESEQDKYWDWLFNLEYNLIGLPKPDIMIYLNVPVKITENNMRNRENSTNTKPDIHETDEDYITNCRLAALRLVDKYNWDAVQCYEGSRMRGIGEINNDIIKILNNKLGWNCVI
jgi:dTMP kinase